MISKGLMLLVGIFGLEIYNDALDIRKDKVLLLCTHLY